MHGARLADHVAQPGRVICLRPSHRCLRAAHWDGTGRTPACAQECRSLHQAAMHLRQTSVCPSPSLFPGDTLPLACVKFMIELGSVRSRAAGVDPESTGGEGAAGGPPAQRLPQHVQHALQVRCMLGLNQ